MNLDAAITAIPGVGEAYAKKLKKLNLNSVSDLLNHFPFRYEDFSYLTPIDRLTPDREFCIKAKILNFENRRTRSRLTIQKALLSDDTGTITATWFNQPFLQSTMKPGQEFYFSGGVTQFRGEFVLNTPEYEPIKQIPIHTARLVPIYPETRGVTSKWLRHKLFLALAQITLDDPLPSSLLTKHSLYTQDQAYHQIHFPDTLGTKHFAEKRLAFNDLLAIYLKSSLTKKRWDTKTTNKIPLDLVLHQRFLDSLDFAPTKDQLITLDHVFSDLNRPAPMNRLIQGDVGSGKTLIAIAAALQTLNQGLKVIVMAPTQVLARQHFDTFITLLKPFGISPLLLTSATTSKKTDLSAKLLIGTHALLHASSLEKDSSIGLIVIDEQHRFGVLQRSHFFKANHSPHILTMSATPIPRTIALSFYGHLDISDIKTLPKGRKKIKTWVVPEGKRKAAYDWIRNQVNQGQQAFIVCPFIDTSSTDSLKNIRAATVEFERLSKEVFPDLRLKLLHGRQKPQEKDALLSDFKAKKFDILVSTPVIEVGVDIPGATIMVIEDAARFGLSQLHQLRGRVGRSKSQSYCLLFSSETESLTRLRLLEKYSKGLILAKYDLKLRGAGELFGTAQAGHLDTQFPMFWDTDLNHLAKEISSNMSDADLDEAEATYKKLTGSLANYVSAN